MKVKIFISYYSKDSNKMLMLKKLINTHKKLIPIVIAERRKSLVPLSEKVEDGIKESQIMIPILTRESIYSQWVNQEIGYATGLTGIKIMPIIDSQIINDLKGFIHKQVDLSYSFQSFVDNKKKEGIHFKKCINNLFSDILEEYNINESTDKNILLYDQLVDALHNEKYFLNPNLTIDELAKTLKTNRTELSNVINTIAKKQFNNFINEFRVNEAINYIIDPNYNFMKLEVLADCVGFNSASVFYKSFKGITGVTPSHFIKYNRHK